MEEVRGTNISSGTTRQRVGETLCLQVIQLIPKFQFGFEGPRRTVYTKLGYIWVYSSVTANK